MSKQAPQNRWRDHVLERYQAFKISGKWKPLRSEGLKLLGRRKLYSMEEWGNSFRERVDTPGFIDWALRCEQFGRRYDLGKDAVIMTCLVRSFRPEIHLVFYPIEADWPSFKIVTESSDEEFVRRLCYEAQRLGACVVRRIGGVESAMVNMEDQLKDLPPVDYSKNPDARFTIRVETTPDYPPEGAAKLSSTARHIAKEISSRIGIPVKQRLRTSKLVKHAKDLRVGKGKLKSGEAYEIVEKLHPNGDWAQDQIQRKRVIQNRHQLSKRLRSIDAIDRR